MSSPHLAVVLVNYNNEEDTTACLETLANQTYDDFYTVVVDNGSEPGSFKRVTDRFNFPVYLRNDSNLGFTGGNNAGIEHALDRDTDWVLLLNNDTEVDPAFLEEFVDAADELSDDVGIVGPKIHAYDSSEIWSAGGTLDRWTASTGSLSDVADDVDRPANVDLVAGAALLVRDEVFEEIGLLDDDFFIYYEETEFCARARAAGWTVMYVPVEGVRHKETRGHTYTVFSEYYLVRNRWNFQHKTRPLHVRAVFSVYYVVRWLLFQALYVRFVEGKPDVARATIAGGLDALRGRTGRGHPEDPEFA